MRKLQLSGKNLPWHPWCSIHHQGLSPATWAILVGLRRIHGSNSPPYPPSKLHKKGRFFFSPWFLMFEEKTYTNLACAWKNISYLNVQSNIEVISEQYSSPSFHLEPDTWAICGLANHHAWLPESIIAANRWKQTKTNEHGRFGMYPLPRTVKHQTFIIAVSGCLNVMWLEVTCVCALIHESPNDM